MKRMHIIIATFTAIALLSPAQAGQKTDDILKLMSLTGVSKHLDQVIKMYVPDTLELVRLANPKIPKKIIDEMKKKFIVEFKRSQPELLGQVIILYSNRFTHQEIKDLIAFYETPTGQKIIRIMPNLTEELAAIGKSWGADVGARVYDRMIKGKQERGY